MLTRSLDVLRPDADKTRAELVLARTFKQWEGLPEGDTCANALQNFLGTVMYDNTLRSYAYAITEFLTWLEVRYTKVPTLDQVQPRDAAVYTEWLQRRESGYEKKWLEDDPSRPLDLVIYRAVEAQAGVRISGIREAVARAFPEELVDVRRYSPEGEFIRVVKLLKMDRDAEEKKGGGLAERLGCLVQSHIIRREPSIDQIRRGVAPGVTEKYSPRNPINPEVFRYYLIDKTASVQQRAGAIVARLACLLSLWSRLKNTPRKAGDRALVPSWNIWSAPLKQMSSIARSNAYEARKNKTPTLDLAMRLLGTTFYRSHKENYLAAASEFYYSSPRELDRNDTGVLRDRRHIEATLLDIRDRLVIVLMGQLGLRRTEIGGIQRQHISETELKVEFTKRGKSRTVGMQPAVWRAYQQLLEKVAELSRERALEMGVPGAPVVPRIKLWGANATVSPGRLTGAAVAMMLRRRAVKAGLAPGDVDFKKIHPHGFRRLFAQGAVAAGTTLPVVQAILGHSNVATTSLYVEEYDVQRLVSVQFAPKAAPVAAAPAAPPSATVEQPEAAAPAETPVGAPPPRGRKPRAAGKPAVPAAEPILVSRGVKDVYETSWGESGRRRALVFDEFEKADAVARNIYVGHYTGLPWWDGDAKRLLPKMPIMSPAQTVSCSESSLCEALSKLWDAWGTDDTRGMSAQAALVEWTGTALLVADRLETHVINAGGTWVPFSAPDAATAKDLAAYREHKVSAIVSWFEKVGWQRYVSVKVGSDEARTLREVLGPEFLPAWARTEDPILDLPTDEREEMLDWVQVMLGRPLLYASADVRGAIKLIRRCSAYEDARERWVGDGTMGSGSPSYANVAGAMRTGASFSKLAAVERASLAADFKKYNDASRRGGMPSRLSEYGTAAYEMLSAANDANELVAMSGKVPDFDFAAEVFLRKAEYNRQLAEKKKADEAADAARMAPAPKVRKKKVTDDEDEGTVRSRYRRDMYLAIAERVFGRSVVRHAAVEATARWGDGESPLKERVGLPITIDPEKKTLVHTDAIVEKYAKGFIRDGKLQQPMQHSECVIRRMIRNLWELRKLRVRLGKSLGPSAIGRSINASLDVRVPCSRSQERKLMDLARGLKVSYSDVWDEQRKFESALAKVRSQWARLSDAEKSSELGRRVAAEVRDLEQKLGIYEESSSVRSEVEGEFEEAEMGASEDEKGGRMTLTFKSNAARRALPNPIRALFMVCT